VSEALSGCFAVTGEVKSEGEVSEEVGEALLPTTLRTLYSAVRIRGRLSHPKLRAMVSSSRYAGGASGWPRHALVLITYTRVIDLMRNEPMA
jgi:hypothetical protein